MWFLDVEPILVMIWREGHVSANVVQETKDGLARVQDFLEQVALWSEPEKAAEEEEQEGSPDKVNVMTLHLSKGLEFAVVFIVGRHKGYAHSVCPCNLSSWLHACDSPHQQTAKLLCATAAWT